MCKEHVQKTEFYLYSFQAIGPNMILLVNGENINRQMKQMNKALLDGLLDSRF